VVPFELDNSLQLAAGRFIFSQQMIRPRNNALSEGFDSLLRGILGQAGFWGGSG
jgi:hypothetical protein